MSNSEQDQLIGIHKDNSESIFSVWLEHEDKSPTDRKKHRILIENESERDEAIDVLSDHLIEHHINEYKKKLFEKKKEILDKYDFSEFLKKQKPFPTTDKTKKGNCTEVILSEYLQFTSGLDLLVYRLRYNPNVDQSMKGDDVLLFNRQDPSSKILKGEAKYRGTPNSSVIEDIVTAGEDDKKMPVSISFVADRVSELGEVELAEKLYDINAEMYKLDTSIVNVGLLLSNHNTSRLVDEHFDSDNPDFVILSLGVNNAQEIIEESFELAFHKLEIS